MFGRSGALIGNVIFPYLLALGCVQSFVYVGVVMLCKLAGGVLYQSYLIVFL